MSPGGVPPLYSPVQTCIHTHTQTLKHRVYTKGYEHMFLFFVRGVDILSISWTFKKIPLPYVSIALELFKVVLLQFIEY